MIIDLLPNQHEAIAAQYNFRPWQTGLLGNMLTKGQQRRISMNMGRNAGHTYFTRVVASDLLMDQDKVHEPIELLGADFDEYGIEFVLVDMNGEAVRRFKEPLAKLYSQLPESVRLVILQAEFFVF